MNLFNLRGQGSDFEERKGSFWKFALGLVAILFLGFSVLVGIEMYKAYQGQESIHRLAEGIKQAEQDVYNEQMADTYGGKTPQETLQLYITAVEKGDYELASKYFVDDKRGTWQTQLQEIKNAGKLDAYLLPLRQDLLSEGEYSNTKLAYSIYKPVKIDFTLYPNGIWKITEI